jgi:hypothetical protein
LAAGVTASASAAKASASLLSAGFIQLLTHMTTTKTAAGAAAIAIAVAIASSVLKQQQVDRLRRENSGLVRENTELADLRVRNQQLEKLQVDADELARLRMERGEFFRLRGELALLRERLRELQNAQSKSVSVAAGSAAVQPQPGGDVAPGLYQADSWTNQGFITPQGSAMTFFWSLRGGHAQEYSESLGKTNLLSLPVEWAHALADIKGSQFSETLSSEEGSPMVSLLHEMKDGSAQNTWLTLTNVDGRWRIRSMIGYPIVVHEVKVVSGK